jgi:hypothetical protein
MVYTVIIRGSFTIHSFHELDKANDLANYAYANGKVVTMATARNTEAYHFSPSLQPWQRQALGIE